MEVEGSIRVFQACAGRTAEGNPNVVCSGAQAGGKGSTGVQRVLDVNPDKVHQRVPLFIGSPGEVEYVESFFK